MKTLCDITKEEFAFLQSDYDCTLISSKIEGWGFEVIYGNSTTLVEITYEWREAYLLIVLYDRSVKKDQHRTYRPELLKYGSGLDWIVEYRDPSASLRPTYEYDEESPFHDKEHGIRNYFAAFAEQLRTYASDVLQGDFSVFEEIKNFRQL